jgi:hypothetical protein
MDMDEFLTGWNHTDFSLERLLNEHAAPFFRLPWWLVGSDAIESRPKALVIDAYKGGQLQPLHLKTIAKSEECLDFNYTLHPQVARPDEVLPALNMTRHAYTQQSHIHSFEKRTLNFSGSVIAVPATKLFVKHYMYLSWEEFQSQRANYTYNSMGDRTMWAVDPRKKWLGGNFNPQHEIANEFTSHMSARVLASFRNEHSHGHLPCKFCHVLWSL